MSAIISHRVEQKVNFSNSSIYTNQCFCIGVKEAIPVMDIKMMARNTYSLISSVLFY